MTWSTMARQVLVQDAEADADRFQPIRRTPVRQGEVKAPVIHLCRCCAIAIAVGVDLCWLLCDAQRQAVGVGRLCGAPGLLCRILSLAVRSALSASILAIRLLQFCDLSSRAGARLQDRVPYPPCSP